MATSGGLHALRHVLMETPPGPIAEPGKSRIEGLLADAWPELEGGEAEGMAAWKLRGRTEQLDWQPPCLSFVIERHGATVLGSTRAELHGWEVNVETGGTRQGPAGYRQLSPHDRPVRVGPLADEVVRAI